MADFRFLLKSNYLKPEYDRYDRIPLANEIRLKYTEHIRYKALINALAIYDTEMSDVLFLNQKINGSYDELDKLIRKMDPFLNFSRQDSILLFSNEFIWTYKNCVKNYNGEFLNSKWLVQKTLIMILLKVDRELEGLGVEKRNDIKKCSSPKFYERFECENNRTIQTSDSVSRVDILTIKNRMKYLDRERNQRQ